MGKVIFLDIDGVLAPEWCWEKTVETKWHKHMYKWDENAVSIFNEIISQPNVDYVVSSDWGKKFHENELNEILEWNGITKKPIGITKFEPVSFGRVDLNRANEIMLYVKENNLSDWIAVDDLFLPTVPNFIWCNPKEGLSGNDRVEHKNIRELLINFITKQ